MLKLNFVPRPTIGDEIIDEETWQFTSITDAKKKNINRR